MEELKISPEEPATQAVENPVNTEQTTPLVEMPAPLAVEEQVIEEVTVPKKKSLRIEWILGIIALVLALAVGGMIAICYPQFGMEEDPEAVISHRPAPTSPTETEPQETTEPLPEPEKNPYGRLDFQYEGRYLGCIKADTIPGIDVSYYQGDIDWQKVKDSGIEFVIIRLGYRGYGKEGKIVEDKNFRKNIQGALDADLKVGIYFFSQSVNVEEALEEAEYVLKNIKGYDITMPVVYDWEYVSAEARTAHMDRRTLTDCYLAFCGKIAEAGYTPMPYFNWNQSTQLMNLWELEEYPFWLALYSSSRMNYPYRVEMWQYTSTGSVPGINGNVDINVYMPW